MRPSATLAVIDGVKWFYEFAAVCQILESPIYQKMWHLWDADHEYHGHFGTKSEMMTYIEGTKHGTV